MEGRSESIGYFKQRFEDKKVFGVLISDKILQKNLIFVFRKSFNCNQITKNHDKRNEISKSLSIYNLVFKTFLWSLKEKSVEITWNLLDEVFGEKFMVFGKHIP